MRTPNSLTCREAVDLITDYLDAALPSPLLTTYERHLTACPECDIFLRQIRSTIWLTHRLALQPAPPGTREAPLRVFRAWKNGDQTILHDTFDI